VQNFGQQSSGIIIGTFEAGIIIGTFEAVKYVSKKVINLKKWK